MFRSFMRLPSAILGNGAQPSSRDRTGKLLQLPDHVLDTIFDYLDVLDRCSLALISKNLLVYAQRNEHLDYIMHSPPSVDSLQHFFEQQLGRGWIPRDLRYCPDCGKFVSTDQYHWRHVSEKYTRELTGRISQLWRERREDGWLRYWIERWCENAQSVDNNARALTLEDMTQLLCPRCAIQNPNTNAWRTKRLAARNERHKGNLRSKLVSPGLNSPGPSIRSPLEASLVRRHGHHSGRI